MDEPIKKNGGIYKPATSNQPLRQGEILSDVTQLRREGVGAQGTLEVRERLHPIAIVLSQTCDLQWDFKGSDAAYIASVPYEQMGKQLPSILFCEIVTAADLKNAGHFNSELWKRVRQNNDGRYQFLEAVPPYADLLAEGLPEMGLDFKRYFTVPTKELYCMLGCGTSKRRCVLDVPYAEHLASRFFHYQARIALPKDHYSESTTS